MASESLSARLTFLIGGPILFILLVAQGYRQIDAQQKADAAFMQSRDDIRDERAQNDAKVDELYALLEPRMAPLPEKSKPSTPSQKPASAPPKSQPPLPPANGALTVSQSSKISTRPDAPYETEIVIQTTVAFPELKFALQCDQDLVYGNASTGGGVSMMVRSGVLKDRPNVFIYSYGSSVPPFDPAHPLVVDVWSKEPVTCNQAATF